MLNSSLSVKTWTCCVKSFFNSQCSFLNLYAHRHASTSNIYLATLARWSAVVNASLLVSAVTGSTCMAHGMTMDTIYPCHNSRNSGCKPPSSLQIRTSFSLTLVPFIFASSIVQGYSPVLWTLFLLKEFIMASWGIGCFWLYFAPNEVEGRDQ